MGAQLQPGLTAEQYLAIERAAEFRSDYYRGEMFAMSGGSMAHAVLIATLTRLFGNAVEDRPCTVASSDLRVNVSKSGLYTHPDVIVVCGEPQFADGEKDTLLNPTILAEVLSPTTESYDRGFKSAQYRTLSSLEEYALISQEEARVEIYRRQQAGGWLLNESVGLESTARFGSLDLAISLADLYAKVTLEGPVLPPRPPMV